MFQRNIFNIVLKDKYYKSSNINSNPVAALGLGFLLQWQMVRVPFEHQTRTSPFNLSEHVLNQLAMTAKHVCSYVQGHSFREEASVSKHQS